MADANNTRPDLRRSANQRNPPSAQSADKQPRPRDTRNAQRLRNFLQRKNPNQTDSWAEEFDTSHIEAKRSDPKKRNPNKKNNQTKREEADPLDYRGKTETPQKNEPLYDIGGCIQSTPLTEKYCMNFDLAGFVPLVQQTYEAIKAVDPRLERNMPYAAFLHHCNVYLNAVFLDRDREQGGRPFSTGEYATDLLTIGGTEYLVPEVIQEYVRNIGHFTTPTGSEVLVNVPAIAIPQGPRDGVFESGFFGACDQNTHNVYECYVSPAVTARYVIACSMENPDWMPLPAELAPAGGRPNRNLLGYGPIQPLTIEGRARLTGFEFPNQDVTSGIAKANPQKIN